MRDRLYVQNTLQDRIHVAGVAYVVEKLRDWLYVQNTFQDIIHAAGLVYWMELHPRHHLPKLCNPTVPAAGGMPRSDSRTKPDP